MTDLNIFKQKKFWKALFLLATFIIAFITITNGYFFLLGNSTKTLAETEFAKLSVDKPSQLIDYGNEIIATLPVVNKIYAEWIGATLFYYLLTTIIFALIYGNALSLLHKNKLFTKKEVIHFTLFSFFIIGIALFIIITTVLVTKPAFMPYAPITTSIILSISILLTGAAAVVKKPSVLDTIVNAIAGIPAFILPFVVSTISVIIIANFVIRLPPVTGLPTFVALTLIWYTWLMHKAIKVSA